MKKLLLAILLFASTQETFAWNFIYPFDKVAAPKCRFSKWSSLSDDCKMTLPRISWADYTKFKDDKTLRKVYSILWWSTYNYGWDVWYWSHLWVDIATSEWTPIRSIWDWEVITAGFLNWWWNTVVVKHKLSDSKYIYSNYSHMSKIIAIKWNIVKAWETIWEVWSTWNSYWNHLHFQIDITSQAHPYWYTTCSKWIDIMDVVNNWQCRDYLLANTVDPIVFLEWNWSFTSIDSIQSIQSQTKKIEQKNIKTREEILEEEIQEFLKNHSFDFQTQAVWDNLEVWKTYLTKLLVYKNWKPFDGNLPWNWVEFWFDPKLMRVFPEKAIIIEKWERIIEITWKKNVAQTLNIKLWKTIVTSKQLNFYKQWDLSSPTDATIQISWKSVAIWEEKIWWIIFKTKYWSDQINIPYWWRYKIKTTTWKAKFCNISFNKSKRCSAFDLTYELDFSYEDTNAWILVFNMIPLDYSPIKLVVQKIWSKNDITWTKWSILVNNPNRLDTNYTYFQEEIEAIKKSLIRLKDWYLMQDRDFVWSDAKELINNLLAYEFLKSWNDIDRKNRVIAQLKRFYKNAQKIDDNKKIARWEFIKILFDNLWFIVDSWGKELLYDEKWTYKDYMITARTKYQFRWKDQYSEHYFQPDKTLTIWEWIYMIYTIWSKVAF